MIDFENGAKSPLYVKGRIEVFCLNDEFLEVRFTPQAENVRHP